MIVHSAWLGSSPQLLDIATAIKCDPVSEVARIHVVLTSPRPTGFADAGRKPRQPIQFEVDPQSWTAASQSQVEEPSVVADFLGSLPASHRDSLCELAEQRREAYCKLKGRSVTAKLRGETNLVYWSDFEEENQLRPTMLDQFFDGLRSYLVTDCYCLRPNCDCKSAHLVFHRINHEDMTTEDVCLTRLPFENGELKLEDISGDRVEAMTMIGRWQSDRSDLFLPELKWRYAKMRGSATTATSRRVDSGRPASASAKRKDRRKKRKGRRK